MILQIIRSCPYPGRIKQHLVTDENSFSMTVLKDLFGLTTALSQAHHASGDTQLPAQKYRGGTWSFGKVFTLIFLIPPELPSTRSTPCSSIQPPCSRNNAGVLPLSAQ